MAHVVAQHRRERAKMRDVPARVDVDLVQRAGITAAELAERGKRSNARTDSVSAGELQRWLLEQRLAVLVGGLLRPTSRGLDLGATLELG